MSYNDVYDAVDPITLSPVMHKTLSPGMYAARTELFPHDIENIDIEDNMTGNYNLFPLMSY